MGGMRRRVAFVCTWVVLSVAGVVSPTPPGEALPTGTAPAQNPVVVENQRPGSTAWRIPWAGKHVASDRNMGVKGFATAVSVNTGQSIGIKVHAATPGPASYRVYRLGWYQGLGGRYVTGGDFKAIAQPTCVSDKRTGLITCPWSTTFTISTAGWVSGAYVVVLTRGTMQSYASFVVRDDQRKGSLVHLQPVLTYQAYNNFPDDGRSGRSLYAYNSFGAPTVGGTTAAVKVGFDRPYWDSGAAFLLSGDAPMIRYAESRGFDVTYATDVDLHERPDLLTGQRALLSVGHNEYWSAQMFTAAERARDAGVGLAFLGGNAMYWQVRLEPSIHGVADRVVVSYRRASSDPVKGATATVRFREAGRPEQPVLGQMWPASDGTGLVKSDRPWVVQDAGHWFYRGTGLSNGSQIPALVGGEADRRLPGYPSPAVLDGTSPTLLARSPFTASNGRAGTHESTLYQSPSHAYVFSAGTLRYTRGLMGEDGHAQQTVRTMTTNLLARYLGARLSATVSRVGGVDRYATAVALSRHAFPAPGVPVAFIATGTTFPDALAAGAATQGKGPVLLVPGDSVPETVLDEVRRLRPQRIYVVGGSAAVSDAVQDKLSAAAGVQVRRLAGIDRYATAAAVSRAIFGVGAPIAYVATGANFPDALAASAAGAQLGGPVLLTSTTGLPTVTRTELVRVAPRRTVVVGGTGVVSGTIFGQVTSTARSTVRIGGADRYETAMLIARDLGAPGSYHRVGLATAVTFPDALAAAPAVAAAGGSLLLVGGALSPALAEELVRSDPDEVLVAGLAGAVPDNVLSRVAGLFAQTVRP